MRQPMLRYRDCTWPDRISSPVTDANFTPKQVEAGIERITRQHLINLEDSGHTDNWLDETIGNIRETATGYSARQERLNAAANNGRTEISTPLAEIAPHFAHVIEPALAHAVKTNRTFAIELLGDVATFLGLQKDGSRWDSKMWKQLEGGGPVRE